MMCHRTGLARAATFRYWRDPLCLACWLAYVLNRFWLKPWLGPEHLFWHGHFNDLLLVPSAIPPLLGLHRLLRLRDHDCPPSVPEVALHLLFWSFFFEFWGPRALHHSTGDWWDVAVYWLGGVLAWCWWQLGAKETFASLERLEHGPFWSRSRQN